MLKNTRFTIKTLDHKNKHKHSENSQKFVALPTIDIVQLIVNQKTKTDKENVR